MTDSISIIIPTISTRKDLLQRAIASVNAQTQPVDAIIIVEDDEKQGAAATRERALHLVETDFVLPLDDDDTLQPYAVEKFLEFYHNNDFNMIYGHYNVIGGTDPRPDNFDRPFDPTNPVQTTIVVFSETEAAQSVGYVNPDDTPLDSPDRLYAGEDWFFIQEALRQGYSIGHMPERVFNWYHWHDGTRGNTSGLAKNW